MFRKTVCIIAMCLGIFVTMLDTTIMNIALPSIRLSLDTNLNNLSWALNAYTITFAALTIPFGKLANIYGKKLFYLIALLLFLVGSVVSGISTTLFLLVLGRIIQSLGAAILFPLSMDLAISTQPNDWKGKAALFVGITQGGASATGPVFGGIITQYLGWRYIFLINIPIVVISFFLSLYALPKNIEKEQTKVDWLGTILAVVSLSIGTLLIIESRIWKFTLPTILCLFLFILSSVLFLILEKKTSDPIINFNLFKNRNFNLATMGTIFGQFFLVGFMVIMPTFLTNMFNKSELSAALLVTPATIMIFLISPFAGKAVKRINPVALLSVGFIIMSIGYLLLGMVKQVPLNYVVYISGSMLIGVGYGLIVGPVSLLSTRNLTGSLLTASQSVIGVLRQLGTVLAVSIFISCLSANLNKARTSVDYIHSFTKLFIYASPVIFLTGICLFFYLKSKEIRNEK
ncbi:MFS transporter [Enterococcus faecium]|nr:MFS transporter [Enterococcus faecium]